MLYKRVFKNKKRIAGFTLIEVLVGVAVFVVIATAMYQAYSSLFVLTSANQYKILALNLANEQFEIVRNLSYENVGEVNGIPNGLVPHEQDLVRGGITFKVVTTIRNVDLPFDGTIGGDPNDLSPADNKLVEVQVECPLCKNYTPISLTTTIAPKNLETASTNGALFIKVFDANGIPVSEADVIVINSSADPDIIIQDETDVNGMLQIVDVPPGVNAYHISVSKSGYSSAQTFPPGGIVHGYLNSTPTQPDATVVVQQVTQVSFAIDKLSTLSFKSLTPLCSPVGNINFTLSGSKTVGFQIPKFLADLSTNGAGDYSSTTMEWDAYNAIGADSTYDIIGISPLNPIPLNPDSVQDVKLIVATKDPRSLLVTVKDSATSLPVTGAEVSIIGPSYSSVQTTDRGYINQTDWSGGPEQEIYENTNRYLIDDGGVAVDAPAGEIRLRNIFGSFASSGSLESSTFDTGSQSNFHNMVWSPTDQPIDTGPDSLKFQIATNNEQATTSWAYTGPDGTENTYYTPSNSVIHDSHDGKRFIRYKVFLNTESTSVTPNVSDIAFTFTSDCTPPGQVVFSGLGAGTYDIQVSKAGYTTSNTSVDVSDDWTEKQVILAP